MNTPGKKMLLALCMFPCIAGAASANAGVPMIAVIMPRLGLAIIPIILIETVFLSRRLELNVRGAAKTVTVSNLVSTLVGIPLTWLILTLIEVSAGAGGAFGLDTIRGKILSVTVQAPWLIPYESDLHWMIPAASLFLSVPFFFASWWSEYFVSKKMLKELPAQRVKTEVRNANILTYALLAIWPIAYWVSNTVP